ncbi:MAG TPA: hypothetical protein P5026_14500 [Kiritimatiellia bacterium]|nr:hypothetical protein [Kiritimatiellia bacterium]HRU71774.1 hypothetical protein [Kiritimatiellia bacterium]
MFKDKAYVCNLCRKVITYSPEEAGKTRPCPFCKSSVTLPALCDGNRVGRTGGSRHRGWIGLIVILLIAGGVAVAWQVSIRASVPQAAESGVMGMRAIHAWGTQRRTADAPKALQAHGVDISVAVTDIRLGCPEIYQAALQRAASTETPVCCVRVELKNTGKKPVRIQPWRLFNSLIDTKRACLKRADGQSYSLVSYGLENDPVGTVQKSELLPDETCCDLILFLCDDLSQDDLELTLPCENIGGKGELIFRIPKSMID